MISQILQTVINNGLLVDEIGHGVFGIPIAYILYRKTKSKLSLIVFYLALYLIDIDHFIEYLFYSGFKIDLVEFFALDFFTQKGTAYLIFHGWEWIALLAIVSYKKGWKSLITAMTLGLFAHLLWDIHNFWNVQFYSIIYRGLNNFSIYLVTDMVKGWMI